jgi:hypothetical protein
MSQRGLGPRRPEFKESRLGQAGHPEQAVQRYRKEKAQKISSQQERLNRQHAVDQERRVSHSPSHRRARDTDEERIGDYARVIGHGLNSE